jgi:hypothetical protein
LTSTSSAIALGVAYEVERNKRGSFARADGAERFFACYSLTMRIAILLVAFFVPCIAGCVDGAQCTKDSDCASGICSIENHVCRPRACSVDADCDDGKSCAQSSLHGNLCVTTPGAGDTCAVGSDCETQDSFSVSCAAGLACVAQNPGDTSVESICISATNRASGEHCTSTADCAAGLTCTPAGFGSTCQ